MARRIITKEEKFQNEVNKLYERAKNKKWNYNLDEFKIDKKFNFSHKSWNGVYCKGGKSLVETIKIINRYISTVAKPYGCRDLSWLHLVNN